MVFQMVAQTYRAGTPLSLFWLNNLTRVKRGGNDPPLIGGVRHKNEIFPLLPTFRRYFKFRHARPKWHLSDYHNRFA